MRRTVLVLGLASCSSTVATDSSRVDAKSRPASESESNTNVSAGNVGTTGEPGASLGNFELTYYWVAYEGDYAGARDTQVGTCEGRILATVPLAFAKALKLEGTAKLLDDRILNTGGCACGGGYSCFAELDPQKFPWGQGSRGNALVPFVTLATDTAVLPFGTIIYAPALDGLALPDSGAHDGCLYAGDVGGAIVGMHIDWFVGLKGNYRALDPEVPDTVELFEGGTRCP